MRERIISAELANLIYDVLVQECAAQEYWRENFVQCETELDGCGEYRFQGALGFGGKFWNVGPYHEHVSCYREDETPAILEMMRKANERIEALFQRHAEPKP